MLDEVGYRFHNDDGTQDFVHAQIVQCTHCAAVDFSFKEDRDGEIAISMGLGRDAEPTREVATVPAPLTAPSDEERTPLTRGTWKGHCATAQRKVRHHVLAAAVVIPSITMCGRQAPTGSSFATEAEFRVLWCPECRGLVARKEVRVRS